jgi:small subunit ribosomal protein S8
MTDTIADLLTRVRNALKAGHKNVNIPVSNMKKSIAHILYKENYINGYQVLDDGPQGTLRIYLRYSNDGEPVITGLSRISKPGLRIFKGSKEIPRTLNGLGLTIVTTPKGVMTDSQARAENVGGEVLCRVW